MNIRIKNRFFVFIERLIIWFRGRIHSVRIHNLSCKTKLAEHVIILPGFEIGYPENLNIYPYVSIGQHAFINAEGGVTIHSGCVLGPRVTIFSVNHIVEGSETLPFSNHNSYRPVIIERNCWIGGNCFICPGVRIGEGSVVAGGAVVTKDVPPNSLAGGNPATVIKSLNKEDYALRCEKGQYCDWLTQQL